MIREDEADSDSSQIPSTHGRPSRDPAHRPAARPKPLSDLLTPLEGPSEPLNPVLAAQVAKTAAARLDASQAAS